MTVTALPLLMGVVNVTPDSFSDGGRWEDPEAAIAHGLALIADGADLLDIGGESTRPGATRPLVEEELARVVPVIAELSRAGATVSVDTMRADVACAALEAGASIVNDVSGGLADPEMLAAVAATDATYVAMHWRAHSDRMQGLAVYDGRGGVVAAVCAELEERVEAMRAAGIRDERIVLDPGLGFAKHSVHNWDLLRRIDQVQALGFPVLVGASRKGFLGTLLSGADGPRPVDQREEAGVAVGVLMADRGVWALRVHDVRAHRDALRVVAEMRRSDG